MKAIDQHILKEIITERKDKDSYKGDYGRLLLVGGNKEMGGAIIMAAKAAVYSGAGLVTVASDPSNKTALYSHLPEAMFLDMYAERSLADMIPSVDVIVIGPGLGRAEQEENILESVLSHVKPHQRIIMDGDAIHLFSENHSLIASDTMIFTPHLGEWEKLTGLSPEEENSDINQEQVEQLNATVVLKGHRTEVYDGKEIYQNTVGTPAQATGGMGDTLAGMIAGFLGQFEGKTKPILAAVYLHSAIAEEYSKDNYIVLPTMIIDHIPSMMKYYETLTS